MILVHYLSILLAQHHHKIPTLRPFPKTNICSSSLPVISSCSKHPLSRKKKFNSLKLIDSIHGIRGVDTQPRRKKKRISSLKFSSQPAEIKQTTFSDNVEISDALSKIKRCNIRILSKPSATLSDSNEVDNVIQVGNQIGFKMNGKECDVAHILDDGDHKVDP